MLEVIKELIPLLEGAKNGVVGLVAAYFGLMALQMLLVASVILLIAKWIARVLDGIFNTPKVRNEYWNMYQWNDKDQMIKCLFSSGDIKALLKAVSSGDGYVHGSDLRSAARTLNAARGEK